MSTNKWSYDTVSQSAGCTVNGVEYTIYREGDALEAHVLHADGRYVTVGPIAGYSSVITPQQILELVRAAAC